MSEARAKKKNLFVGNRAQKNRLAHCIAHTKLFGHAQIQLWAGFRTIELNDVIDLVEVIEMNGLRGVRPGSGELGGLRGARRAQGS